VKVLLVDDDADLADAVAVALRFHWPDSAVLTARDGDHALELLRTGAPDVVLLDVVMPGRSGFAVLDAIRRVSDVPVLLMTGLTGATDEVRGLELGADDYVTKPFHHLTLLARIKAVLRRARGDEAATLSVGGLTIEQDTATVRLHEREVRLAPRELRLLVHLSRSPGRVVAREALLEAVWPSNWGASVNDLKVLVGRLRARLAPLGADAAGAIENVRGRGYRLNVVAAGDAPATGPGPTP
jgi:DNA-binding response OmpR family regulator